MVRGVALRSMCNLKLECMLEYVEQPLKKGLTDISAYVRKSAVMGVLKVYHVSPSMIENDDYVATLYKMVYDVDSTVVINAIMVLNEMAIKDGGLQLTVGMLMHLLNRIGDFNEWGLNLVLDLVCRYTPSSDDEVYAIMNLLDPVLRTTNSGAVLATIRCFLHVTAEMPDMQPQIYKRTKPPLLTFITGGQPEVQFSILKHLELILKRPAAQGIFNDEYRQLFVRYNEPPHVKHLKVDVLAQLANEANAGEISAELVEYVTDIDAELSRGAINALAEIAMGVNASCAEITQKLVELIDIDVPHVRNESIKAVGRITRKFPGMCTYFLPALARCLKKVEDPEAHSVLIWMLGEFGKQVVEAPYKLEKIIDCYEELSAPVKLQTLTATMKLFFKRPPEVQAMLGRLLEMAVNDSSSQDVHDRGLFYYRLLVDGCQSSMPVAATLFAELAAAGVTGQEFMEQRPDENMRKVQKEFNSLSVIYGRPASKFLEEKFLAPLVLIDSSTTNSVLASVDMPAAAAVTADTTAVSVFDTTPGGGAPPVAAPAPPATATAAAPVNLLDWDDAPVPVAPAAVPAPQSAGWALQTGKFELTPQQFQQMWKDTPETLNEPCVFNGPLTNPNPTAAGIETCLRAAQLSPIASGAMPSNGGFKLFFYGTDHESAFLCQCVVSTQGGNYAVQITLRIANYVGGQTNINDAVNNFMNFICGNVFPQLL